MRISDFIEKTNESQEFEDVFRIFQSAVLEYGYDRIAFVAVTAPAVQHSTFQKKEIRPVVALNYNDDYVRHYFENNYQDCDPVLRLTPYRNAPFLWSDLVEREPLTDKQRLLFKECRDGGLHNGVTIPVHGPDGESYAICLATDDIECNGRENLGRLHILATQFHLCYSRLEKTGEPLEPSRKLTERERECLSWTARGKSAWAISVILGLSEHTVQSYLKSAIKKFGSTNKVSAVVLAIQEGFIFP